MVGKISQCVQLKMNEKRNRRTAHFIEAAILLQITEHIEKVTTGVSMTELYTHLYISVIRLPLPLNIKY